MTNIQKEALELMAEQNIGAMPVKGFGWIFPTHLRNDGDRFGEERAIEAAKGVVRQLRPDNPVADAIDRCYRIMGLR